MWRKIVKTLAPSIANKFDTSDEYWKRRYRFGGHSGSGSRGDSARYKADTLNTFVTTHAIRSVVELGCGDGQNCALYDVPHYLGLDISSHALGLAKKRCSDKPGFQFALINDPSPLAVAALAHTHQGHLTTDLSLSFDVMFHLIEDDIYRRYLQTLGLLSARYCLIYATDHDEVEAAHVRHRHYSDDFVAMNSGWRLRDRLQNPIYGPEWPQRPHFCVFERT
ncbi:MAG: class I SAM-dependent methyltransferase [Hyphomicrobiaceae bacterium]|nr:class I SAM-dependent methyltransferase [Hyphomicrobiaceae bacterium]